MMCLGCNYLMTCLNLVLSNQSATTQNWKSPGMLREHSWVYETHIKHWELQSTLSDWLSPLKNSLIPPPKSMLIRSLPSATWQSFLTLIDGAWGGYLGNNYECCICCSLMNFNRKFFETVNNNVKVLKCANSFCRLDYFHIWLVLKLIYRGSIKS